MGGGTVCGERRLSDLLIAVSTLHSKSLFTCHAQTKKSYRVFSKIGHRFATDCKHDGYISSALLPPLHSPPPVS